MFRPSCRHFDALKTHTTTPLVRPIIHRRIGPQFAFVLGTSALAVGGAAWLTNKDTADRSRGFWSTWGRSPGTGLQADLARSRFNELHARAESVVSRFRGNRLVVILSEKWLELGEDKRTSAGLIATFAAVFLAWKLPASTKFNKWLMHDPLSGRSFTQLTSVFSHQTLAHFAFNSIGLFGFSTACFSYFGYSQMELLPRSTSRYEFVAFFVAAGLASSFASHVWFSRIIAGRLLRTGSAETVRASILPSLGASGAVYSCLTITALSYPDSSVALIFLPFVPIPIGAATSALILVDLAGLIRGWKMFDHVAHLSGAMFGVWYWIFGHELFEKLRVRMLPHKPVR
ncbi:rhomboid family intramembrane serine protease [Sporobolomyces koalae]|uniref:rhomboid family intramembrane serine protease n=1 Tax=Sporobolomyces koalae TaxID=500713 RepID=UPI00316C4DFC